MELVALSQKVGIFYFTYGLALGCNLHPFIYFV
jgi:hypothetical protein